MLFKNCKFSYHINNTFITNNIEAVRTIKFKPGLSLKPGLKPENWFKSNAHQKLKPGLSPNSSLN